MPSAPLALGIDIGGSTTKIGIVDADGHTLTVQRTRSDLGAESIEGYLQALVKISQQVLQDSPSPVTRIGVSLIGAVSEEKGGTVCAVNGPGLQGVDLRTLLRSSLGLPVWLTNDLTAHALAEYWFGIGAGSRRFLCLALGTGLGAGVVIDGAPVMHWGGTAGDTGRIILDPTSPATCDGGVHGSAEALCSVAGIERLARERYGRHVACPDVIRAAHDGGDPIALGIFRQVGKHLAHLLAILSVIYFPSDIALSGGIAEAGPALLDPCVTEFGALVADYFALLSSAAPDYFPPIRIRKGLIGGDAAMIGAAARALKGGVAAPG